jgi:hypothetical protein
VKINLHTVLDVGEKEVEEIASKALGALVNEFKTVLTDVKHVSSILTTDAGPRQVQPSGVSDEETEAPPRPVGPAPATPTISETTTTSDAPDATVPPAGSDPTGQAVTQPVSEAAGQ